MVVTKSLPRLVFGLAVGGLMAAGLGVEGQPPTSTPSPPSAATIASQDQAAQLIKDAVASFARVKDYVGLLYKQERVNGQLLPEQTIQLRVRQQPFSVHMKWVGPKNLLGQEACYVAGKNNNQLRAKSPGKLLGAIGFVSLDPRDPRVMSSNRHIITEAGLANALERINQAFQLGRQLPPDQVSIALGDFRFLNRPVVRMETTRRVNNGQFQNHRSVVYFDKETRLPVRIESYDWPKPGGPAGGELLECYSYVDLKFNVGLTDDAFNY